MRGRQLIAARSLCNRSTRLFRKLPNQKGGLSRRTCPLLGRKRPLANFVRERNGQFVRRIVGISAGEGSLNVPYATSTGRHGLPSPFDSVDGVGDGRRAGAGPAERSAKTRDDDRAIGWRHPHDGSGESSVLDGLHAVAFDGPVRGGSQRAGCRDRRRPARVARKRSGSTGSTACCGSDRVRSPRPHSIPWPCCTWPAAAP